MIRRLIPLAALVATTAVAASTERVGADTLYAVQDPPTVTVGDIVECTDNTTSCSQTSTVTQLQPGDDGTLVLPTGSESRTIYQVPVTVTTTGTLDTIDVVSVCLYDNTVVADGSYTIENLCGFDDTNTTTRVVAPDPSSGIVTVSNSAASIDSSGGPVDHRAMSILWDNDANLQSDTPTTTVAGTAKHANRGSTSTFSDAGTTMTINFQFSLSYVLTKGADWRLRTVAVDQPPDIGGATPDRQLTEVRGIGCVGNECPSAATPTDTAHSILYYGGITASRGNDTTVDYGTLVGGQTSTARTGLTTGSYVANNTSDFAIDATDFTYTDGQTYTLSLKETGTPGLDEVALNCTRENGSNTKLDPDGTPYTGDVRVTATAKDLVTGEASSTASGLETAVPAAGHQCALTYGGGADIGNVTYTNTVNISILDAG